MSTLDARTSETPGGVGASEVPRRWAVVEAHDAVHLTLWGPVGPAQLEEVDERLAVVRRKAPLVVDLTGVTDLHAETVSWLGERHEEYGTERPMGVVVLTDGHVHRRLMRDDAPRLRLTLE